MELRMHSNQILAEKGESYLIKLPKTELAFWHPKRFISRRDKGYTLMVWFADHFTIKASRKGKRGDVLESWERSPEEVAVKYGIPHGK